MVAIAAIVNYSRPLLSGPPVSAFRLLKACRRQ